MTTMVQVNDHSQGCPEEQVKGVICHMGPPQKQELSTNLILCSNNYEYLIFPKYHIIFPNYIFYQLTTLSEFQIY